MFCLLFVHYSAILQFSNCEKLHWMDIYIFWWTLLYLVYKWLSGVRVNARHKLRTLDESSQQQFRRNWHIIPVNLLTCVLKKFVDSRVNFWRFLFCFISMQWCKLWRLLDRFYKLSFADYVLYDMTERVPVVFLLEFFYCLTVFADYYLLVSAINCNDHRHSDIWFVKWHFKTICC